MRWIVFLLFAACSDSVAAKPDAGAIDSSIDAPFDNGVELRVTVRDSGRVYVNLQTPAVVPIGDPKTSLDWDLAFEGFDVFTNSGASGSGKGGVFGPLDALVFFGDSAPEVPFIALDKTGGAFLDWYLYSGSDHSLWSRYHVYGVRDGARLWKVQILGYYGVRDGAPVSAIYSVRWAELPQGTIQELADIDGTAGGLGAPPSSPGECLDLGTGARTMLTPDQAKVSSTWHLCFRRDNISVNGELGGPRGVGAVDLDSAATASETFDQVKARTADSEKPRFDGVSASSFDGKTLRGDRIVSGFSDKWIAANQTPLAPEYAAWLVASASGTKKFLIGFARFENPTTKSPGTVVMRIKPVKG